MEWTYGVRSGKVITNENKNLNKAIQFDKPFDVILNKKADSLVSFDRGIHRILRWSKWGTQGSIVVGENNAGS